MKTAGSTRVDWRMVAEEIAAVCRAAPGKGNEERLCATLANALRARGWRAEEKVSRRAFYQGRYVSDYRCPILVESAGMIVGAGKIPAKEIAEERVRQLCASLQLEAVWLVSAAGEIIGHVAAGAEEN